MFDKLNFDDSKYRFYTDAGTFSKSSATRIEPAMTLPSSTVEDYLKAIYKAQATLTEEQRLMSMGHLATALGVVPGTATTMVKALADSGLVDYEPYAGVRLTAAGQKLAALVLRRHRVMEQFLVRVVGMSWAEVHDEAERLEHAASDQLIDRLDEMLGYPSTDPHGDPIPDADGAMATHDYHTLLTCPVGIPIVLARVTDQDPSFLRFLEENHLTPGQSVRIEDRDAAGDKVVVRGADGREIVIGMRAAGKLQVRAESSRV